MIGFGVVERSLAWIMNARRHARDYERRIQHSETLITCAAITLMTRRLTRTRKFPNPIPGGFSRCGPNGRSRPGVLAGDTRLPYMRLPAHILLTLMKNS